MSKSKLGDAKASVPSKRIPIACMQNSIDPNEIEDKYRAVMNEICLLMGAEPESAEHARLRTLTLIAEGFAHELEKESSQTQPSSCRI